MQIMHFGRFKYVCNICASVHNYGSVILEVKGMAHLVESIVQTRSGCVII